MNIIGNKKTGFLIILLIICLSASAQNTKELILVDRQGNETVKTVPEDWERIYTGDRFVYTTDPDEHGFENYGFKDSLGNIVIKPIFAMAYDYHEGLAPVAFVQGLKSGYVAAEQATFTSRITKWGYIDRMGKTVIAPAWDDALPFFEGMAAVKKGEKWGFINIKGKTVVPPKYDYVGSFRNGLASVTNKHEYSVIDMLGNELIPFRYSRYGLSFNEGLSRAHDQVNPNHLLWGYIDLSGNWVIDPRFDSAGDFKDSIAAVEYNDRYGFINHQGEFVIQPLYRWAYTFSEGLCAASNEERLWGFIDKTGNECVPFKYTEVRDFSEGLAAVKLGYRWGFIDTKGEMVIEPKYWKAWDFHNGMAEVKK